METKDSIMAKVNAEEAHLRKYGITQIYLCGAHAQNTQTDKDTIVLVLDWSEKPENDDYAGFHAASALDKIAALFGGMENVHLPALSRLTAEEQQEVIEEGLRVL